MKIVRIWSFSCPYFPAFGLNTERHGVSLRIQSECGKIRTRKTPTTETFYTVIVLFMSQRHSKRTNQNVFKKRQIYEYSLRQVIKKKRKKRKINLLTRIHYVYICIHYEYICIHIYIYKYIYIYIYIYIYNIICNIYIHI